MEKIKLMLNSKRAEKGSSLLDFPKDYAVIDVETTGYSPMYDIMIEISALRVRDNVVVDSFATLVKGAPVVIIDEFITELTGITQTMINEAPDIKDVLPQFVDFIGKDIIVGHNVNFDINFLYDATLRILGKTISNNFVDTMRISRRIHPEFEHHRLLDLANYYDINHNGAHRSQRDCEITKECYDSLRNDTLKNWGSYEALTFLRKRKHSPGVKANEIHSETKEFNEMHFLYNKVCVFTGTLEKMTRREAMQIVADIGGVNADSVTKKTNYLILGCNDYCTTIKDGKSRKQKKAEELQLKGQDIAVISEDVFYEMVGME